MGAFCRVLTLLFFVQQAQAADVLVLGSESMPWNGLVNGQPAGIYVDTLNEATRHGAPRFTFRLDLPWARAQRMVMEDNSMPAVIIPLTRTSEREQQYQWIAAVYADDHRLVSFKRKQPIKTIEEARDLTIGVVNGHSVVPRLKELGLTKIEFTVSAELNMLKLSRERVDMVCEARMVYLYIWKKIGMDVAELQEGPVVATSPFAYIAAGPNFPADLATEISTAVEKMKKDGSFQKIIERWKK